MAAVLAFDADITSSDIRSSDITDSCMTSDAADVDEAVAVAFAKLALLPAVQVAPRIDLYCQQLTAIEMSVVGQVVADKGEKAGEQLVSRSGKKSKKATKKAVARAKLGAKNPTIGKKVFDGDLTDEQVDVIADTDKKTNGAAGSDDEFINDIANASVDRSSGVAADFIAKTTDSTGAQSRHDRQRAARKAIQFHTDRRTDAIMFEGDRETINEIWAATNKQADVFYRQDGGRDLAVTKHPRTRDQRQFDALVHILKHGYKTEPPADDQSESPAPTTSSRRTTKRTTKKHRPANTTVRPTIVVTATLDKVSGNSPDEAAQLIGSGPIADSVLAEYLAADPDIVGLIFGLNSQPLWLGRSVRLASNAQHLALIVRDKGCVLCGAHHTKCKAHHVTPWSAPAAGETNITDLVLVCDSCHHHIHDNHLTIYCDPADHHWKLRPAYPHEIAPPRPRQPQRGQAPQLK